MRTIIALSVILVLAFSGCIGQKCPDTNAPVCGSDGITYPNACQAVQAGAQVRANGTCEATSCVDSDGGKDLFTQGTATGTSGAVQDECADALNLKEAYCSGKAAASESFPCPAGYACTGGECVKTPCQDSDGAKDKTVKGTVTVPGRTLSDECAGPNAVKEYYCSGNDAASEDIQCGSGMQCTGGACVEAPCADSDNGKNATVAGTATKGGDSYPDSCSGDASVKEYYCDANTVRYDTVACQSGFSCKMGACVKEVCTETDSGKDAPVKGTTTYAGTSNTDSCYSATTVLEYYCSSTTTIDNEKILCGSGKECKDGRCQAVDCQETTVNVDESDERYSMGSFDDADEIVMRAGESVEIGSGLFLKLYSVGSNSSTFRLYDDYEAFMDGDQRCSITIDSGDSKDNFCSKSTGTVEVLSADSDEDTAELSIEKYYATEYYSVEGSMTDWTDNPVCPDDSTVFELFDAKFYPYMSTASGGLDLGDKKFVIFDTTAIITEVTDSSISFELDGDDFELEDGDDFDYNGEEYTADLTFNDDGLVRFKAVPS